MHGSIAAGRRIVFHVYGIGMNRCRNSDKEEKGKAK
jgi:hypothetical protein